MSRRSNNRLIDEGVGVINDRVINGYIKKRGGS